METVKARIEDIEVGKIFWLEYMTDCGEGCVADPAIVETTTDDKITFRFLSLPFTIGGKRYAQIKYSRQSAITAMKTGEISFPDPEKLKMRIQGEKAWIAEQKAFLDEYSKAIESVPID